MIFIVACLAVMLPVLLGGFFAWITAGMDTRVQNTNLELEEKDKGYNETVTIGHKIKVQADPEEQLKEARLLAAKRAATMPRGANMRIGRLGETNLRTAGDVEALQGDPVTAVRIATYHGWDGAKTGAVAVAATPAPAAAGPAAAPTGKITLVPGKDYQVIEITDDMTPDEKRKARIANSKAKSAAMKAAKAAGVPAAAAPTGTAAPAAAPAAASPTAVSIEPPQLIEITDDMEPQAKAKARIANSKAKSAFNKALKAAGVDPKDVEIVDGQVVIPGGAPAAAPSAAPVAASPTAATTAAEPAAVASSIPAPEYIEITDDMEPQEKAKARIANSKAKSAYNKALKAAGIDPKSVN